MTKDPYVFLKFRAHSRHFHIRLKRDLVTFSDSLVVCKTLSEFIIYYMKFAWLVLALLDCFTDSLDSVYAIFHTYYNIFNHPSHPITPPHHQPQSLSPSLYMLFHFMLYLPTISPPYLTHTYKHNILNNHNHTTDTGRGNSNLSTCSHFSRLIVRRAKFQTLTHHTSTRVKC